jgi:hypothetical protein
MPINYAFLSPTILTLEQYWQTDDAPSTSLDTLLTLRACSWRSQTEENSYIHALSGIRTHDLSDRALEDRIRGKSFIRSVTACNIRFT